MLYSVIDTKKGENAGFASAAHILLKDGGKMIVNENELRKAGDDIVSAARELGGGILTHSEVTNIMKKDK